LRYTKYEKARIIGARALQIAMGAPVLIDTPEGMADPIDIALLEFEKKVTPLTVIREKRRRVSFPRVT
jgi:DNA-directed RNA polymerase subunit K